MLVIYGIKQKKQLQEVAHCFRAQNGELDTRNAERRQGKGKKQKQDAIRPIQQEVQGKQRPPRSYRDRSQASGGGSLTQRHVASLPRWPGHVNLPRTA